jgi:hypothetical protein
LSVGRDFAFVGAVNGVDAEVQLGVFQRNGTHGNSIAAGLVDAVERRLESVVCGFGDVKDEAEFGATGLESALPIASYVLSPGEAGSENEDGQDESAVHGSSLGREKFRSLRGVTEVFVPVLSWFSRFKRFTTKGTKVHEGSGRTVLWSESFPG